MELTRRDAIEALVAGGVVSAGTLAISEVKTGFGSGADNSEITETDLITMVALAEVVYPSEVDVSSGFIETYVNILPDGRRSSISDSVDQLNKYSRKIAGDPFHEISSVSKRDGLLRLLGVDKEQSKPKGSVPERIRFHLVNGLLYALFTSPKGSSLVGIEDPAGYPGGFATYSEQDRSKED